MFTALDLSRFQFAFTITFHILFPAFSIGLAMFLSVMEGLWLKTKKPVYYEIVRFWTKVFALTFGMGVVSGIVMEFQLGTNWAGFSNQVGSVLGPLFVYEVLSAFFIEAGFIGVMIFGWNKVGPKLHYASTLLVMFGTTLSAYWIMSANSWMQHPVGYQLLDGKFSATDWWQIVFNPYTLPRFIHMMLASYLATSFVIISVSSYYLLRNKFVDFSKTCLKSAIIVVMLLIPLQIFVGDESGLKVREAQPIKTAAIEGIWPASEKGAALLLFALPSQAQQKNLFEVGIPHGAALINTHEWNGQLAGLKSVDRQDQPQVWVVFYTFRIMVGIAFLMLLYPLVGLFLLKKKKIWDSPWFLKFGQYMAPAGFIAIMTGWFTAEIGRQPWVVFGVLRTAAAVSHVSMHDVMISFLLIFIVYGIIFGVFYFYFLHKTIQKGPADFESIQPFYFLPPIEIIRKGGD